MFLRKERSARPFVFGLSVIADEVAPVVATRHSLSGTADGRVKGWGYSLLKYMGARGTNALGTSEVRASTCGHPEISGREPGMAWRVEPMGLGTWRSCCRENAELRRAVRSMVLVATGPDDHLEPVRMDRPKPERMLQ